MPGAAIDQHRASVDAVPPPNDSTTDALLIYHHQLLLTGETARWQDDDIINHMYRFIIILNDFLFLISCLIGLIESLFLERDFRQIL
jgi:hypothetical protein